MVDSIKRQVVLDTETTGLNPEEGHRIIEIGCVELINRRLTGQHFHVYLNPESIIDEGAIEVHGISNEFLADKPRFEDVYQDFIEYIRDSELIIHNAPFDVGFINHEFSLLGKDIGKLEDYSRVMDTLAHARKKHPGQRNSLDALCKRYGIDNSHRDLHGALLDAEILAEVFLQMTGGQSSLFAEHEHQHAGLEKQQAVRSPSDRPKIKVVTCTDEELQLHQKRLEAIDEASGGSVWNKDLKV